MIRRYFKVYELENVDDLNKKDLYRTAKQKDLITDTEKWFKFHNAINETSHIYNQNIAESVLQVALEFIHEAKYLRDKLKDKTSD